MHVLILAGGFATRLWPLTEKTAKPLIPVAGKPLISYMIENIPESFLITISTNQVFAQDFENWKREYFPSRNIEIFVEDSIGEQKKKGALAAVALFLEQKKIDTSLALLAGDNYFGFSIAHFLEHTKEFPLLASYDIGSHEEAKKFGVVIPKDNRFVAAFQEKPEHPDSTLVSTGAYVFPKDTHSHIITYSKKHSDDLGGIFEYFLQNMIPVEYYRFEEDWYDIGSFPAFMEANHSLLQKNNIDKTVLTKGNILYEGKCVVEKNVVLENVELENSIILSGCILKNVKLQNCLVCEQSILENVDFHTKMIRANTIVIR